MSTPCHPIRAHQRDASPRSAPRHNWASARRKQPRCLQLCWRLKIFAHLFPTGQVPSSQAGLLPPGCSCTPSARCSWCAAVQRFSPFYVERLDVVIISLNHPKRMLCPVFQMRALEFNSCYSAIITHFMGYLVTMGRALVIRFGLLLLLYFKDFSAKHFLSALKIVYFSICFCQREPKFTVVMEHRSPN